ncbi:MAG TPA: 23S rRNA (pseudouridine(1915)-N(3))-methyltransferase RlmH [Candidatus Magasanikbacteria bacterium]|nr:23S rRNA (pseudouridine(1915)-N(3))-methyltransferase RlmH [Candidatus Magasanikbacteria bacterium]
MNITILTLGSLKEKYWQEAEAEYIKRLSPYAKIEIRELKEESFAEKTNPEIIKKKEAEKLIKILEKKEGYVIALDSTGKQFTSLQLASHFDNVTMKQFNNLIFVIGGPLGLDDSILELADFKLSLSNLTFTHQMVRTILLEQIYRSMMILNNRSYHY